MGIAAPATASSSASSSTAVEEVKAKKKSAHGGKGKGAERLARFDSDHDGKSVSVSFPKAAKGDLPSSIKTMTDFWIVTKCSKRRTNVP